MHENHLCFSCFWVYPSAYQSSVSCFGGFDLATPRIPRERFAANLARSRKGAGDSVFVRQTYRQERNKARETARQWFKDYPKAAYWTQVESWRLLEDGEVEFTMRRLPSAD